MNAWQQIHVMQMQIAPTRQVHTFVSATVATVGMDSHVQVSRSQTYIEDNCGGIIFFGIVGHENI